MEAYYRVFDTLLADTMPAVRGKPCTLLVVSSNSRLMRMLLPSGVSQLPVERYPPIPVSQTLADDGIRPLPALRHRHPNIRRLPLGRRFLPLPSGARHPPSDKSEALQPRSKRTRGRVLR